MSAFGVVGARYSSGAQASRQAPSGPTIFRICGAAVHVDTLSTTTSNLVERAKYRCCRCLLRTGHADQAVEVANSGTNPLSC